MKQIPKTTYIVENKSKYVGKENPVCRSSWEHQVCWYFDNNPKIVKWSYECIAIPYFSTVDNKLHKYYLDFYLEIKNRDNQIKKYLVEVKPSKQGPIIRSNYVFDYSNKPQPPKIKNQKAMNSYMERVKVYITNTIKWQAAIKFCLERGMDFLIIDENDIPANKS